MAKIGVVKSNFHQDIVDRMVAEMEKTGLDFDLIEVPGAFEIPLALKKSAAGYDYMAAVGCLIRGETKHFDVIAGALAAKIMEISVSEGKPIGFGVITALERSQAEARTDLGKQALLAARDSYEKLYGKNS